MSALQEYSPYRKYKKGYGVTKRQQGPKLNVHNLKLPLGITGYGSESETLSHCYTPMWLSRAYRILCLRIDPSATFSVSQTAIFMATAVNSWLVVSFNLVIKFKIC